MAKIIIEKLHEMAEIPAKVADDTDAAFDVVAVDCKLKYNERGEPRLWYSLGFKTDIPVGYRVKVAPRSSISKMSLRLCNPEGIIDSKYRGEWFVIFEPTFELRKRDINDLTAGVLNDIAGIYQIGDRIAQCYLEEITETIWEEAEVNMDIDRGGGIGSTGNKAKVIEMPKVEYTEEWKVKMAKEAAMNSN